MSSQFFIAAFRFYLREEEEAFLSHAKLQAAVSTLESAELLLLPTS